MGTAVLVVGTALFLIGLHSESLPTFSVPAVVAGVLITHIGLRDTSLAYGAFVGVLALLSLVLSVGAQRAAARTA